MIDASVKGYNENAVTKNSYSDLIAINVKDALNDGSNIINISEALESATGEQLSNGGRKLLTKADRFKDSHGNELGNVFVWNYDECNAGVIKANDNKISVANLQKFFDNGEYCEYDLADLDITDAADKTITLKHTSPVNFAKFCCS